MTEMTVAEMVAHDARVMAAEMGGTVCTSAGEFLAAIEEGARWRQRAARTMPAEAIAQLRRSMRRIYEAIWDGDRERHYAASVEAASLFQEWEPQLTARIEVLKVGDFARVAGFDPSDGCPDAVTGDLVAIHWEEVFIGGRAQLGHVLTVRPPLAEKRAEYDCEVFVPEGGCALRLRRPRRRRRLTASHDAAI
ncbi:hypothetical protein [Micromonospora sp. DT227]|uniref:hypothetical protein n=1 Tax=Micromonospora sp. DT227 TaxID=3393433 RepID=UPI003CF75BDA